MDDDKQPQHPLPPPTGADQTDSDRTVIVRTEEKRQATLRARAAALAQPANDEAKAGQLEVVTFKLGNEEYAIESRWIREVYSLRDLTPLPCTPSYVLGITHIRRRITAVLDLKVLLGLPKGEWTSQSRIIILQSDKMKFGLAVERIIGTQTIVPTFLETGLPTVEGLGRGVLQGVTPSGIIMIDAASLLADENLIVHEEVLI